MLETSRCVDFQSARISRKSHLTRLIGSYSELGWMRGKQRRLFTSPLLRLLTLASVANSLLTDKLLKFGLEKQTARWTEN